MKDDGYNSDDTEIEFIGYGRRAPDVQPVQGAPHPPYAIVAFDPEVQNLLDRYNVPWGVQWEISRLISNGQLSWRSIKPEHLSQLGTRNQDAVPKFLSRLNIPREDNSRVL